MGGGGGSSKLNAGARPWRPNQDGIKYGNKVQSGRSNPEQLVSKSAVGTSGAVSGSAMRATVESPKKKEEESSSAPVKGRKPAALEAAHAAPSYGSNAFGVAAKSEAFEWDANLEIMAAGLDVLAQCMLKA